MKIDHVGVAVKNLSIALETYRKALEIDDEKIIEVPSEAVRVAMLRLGDTRIELLEPLSDEGAIAKFLRERGEGIHHVAIKINGIQKCIDIAEKEGLNVLDEKPRVGTYGSKVAFIHPKSMHGVLLEFVDENG